MSSHSTTNRLAAALLHCDILEREQQRRQAERRQREQFAKDQRQQEKERRREIAREWQLQERSRPKPSPRPDNVYIIRASNGYCKIGISYNPKKRFKELQRQAATWAIELELIHIIVSKNAYGLEQTLHKRFAEQRVTGEWFLLTAPDVEWLQTQ